MRFLSFRRFKLSHSHDDDGYLKSPNHLVNCPIPIPMFKLHSHNRQVIMKLKQLFNSSLFLVSFRAAQNNIKSFIFKTPFKRSIKSNQNENQTSFSFHPTFMQVKSVEECMRLSAQFKVDVQAGT